MDQNASVASGVATSAPMFNTNLLDLNDDCLIEILRLLPVDDLNSVASACTQLNAIARTVFQLRPTAERTLEVKRLHKNGRRTVNETKVWQMLKNFGDLLNEIGSDEYGPRRSAKFNATLIETASKYCNGGRLQTLRIGPVQLTSRVISCGAELFEHLHSFYYDGCADPDKDACDQLLPFCKKLEVLHLSRIKFSESFHELNFPNLTELVFTALHSTLAVAIVPFLLRHKLTIKKLNLGNILHFNLATLEQMTALEELDLCLVHPRYVQADDCAVAQLQLKKIGVALGHQFDCKFVAQQADWLEHIDVVDQVDDSFVESLKQCQNLVSLRAAGSTRILQNLNKSMGTLTHLDLNLTNTPVDNEFAHALNQFSNVHTLAIKCLNGGFMANDTPSLCRLEKLVDFSFHGGAHIALDWLKAFSAPHTVQSIRLEVFGVIDDIEYLRTLKRFVNLKAFTFVAQADCLLTTLNAIPVMDELVELRLTITDAASAMSFDTPIFSDYTWDIILNLAKRLPKLRSLQFKREHETCIFDLDVYLGLAEIFRARDTTLSIELNVCDPDFEMPNDIMAIYGDFCRWIQIHVTRQPGLEYYESDKSSFPMY